MDPITKTIFFMRCFFTESADCQIIMDELESIDDDAYRSGIQFVKTPDLALAKKHGAKSIPALVYYEDRVPFVYDGRSYFISIHIDF